MSVFYGSATGLTRTGGRLFTQASVGDGSEPFDQFGLALAAGDFDGDGYADLAASAPAESVGDRDAAGLVSVLYGSATGLTGTRGRSFTQVGSAPEPFDRFGAPLTSEDYNNDGFADLAAGAPDEGYFTTGGAGAVSVLYGSATGLTRTGGQIFTQVGSQPEPGDAFGDALATGDLNGDGFADLAAAAPAEGYFTTRNAGAVSVLYGSGTGLTRTGGQIFTQVGSQPEPGDFFGRALAIGDLNGDGFADLAAGAAAEDYFTTRNAGAVSVLYGSAAKLTATGGQIFIQVGSRPEPDDFFGNELTSADYNSDGFLDLAATAVFEDAFTIVDAGAVSVLYGSAAKLTATGGQIFTQDTPGVPGTAAAYRYFGEALAR